MKKCPRCKVIFKDNWEFNCLYCEGSLLSVQDADFIPEHQLAEGLPEAKELRFGDELTHGRKDYLMGVFFHGSASLSSFRFYLHDFKKGKEMKRFLIRPLDIDSVIKLPWLLINIVYSALYYFLPKGYCPKCGRKYISFHGETQHDPYACLYNQEYSLIEQEVFSGKVFIDLDPVRQISEQKIKAGERSALYDLVHRDLRLEKALDVGAILLSIFIYASLLVIALMPVLNQVYHFDLV